MTKKNLKGKNCLITGASGGLGREIGRQLAGIGSNLFLTGRSREKLEQLVQELRELNNEISLAGFPGNLNDLTDLKEIIRVVREKFSSIDILINSAGVFPVKNLADSTNEDFERCFNVNVRAPFLLAKEFSREMIKNRWGRIVNIGSSSAYGGFKETSLYCASKHALLGLSRSFFEELKEFGDIRTFFISPAGMKTDMGRKIKNHDFQTFIDPKEVAEYVVFAISFNGSMVSQEIRLNRISNA